MKKVILLTILAISTGSAAEDTVSIQLAEKLVECTGNTVIEVNNRIGAQTPFHAIFKVQGETVTMVEGDSMRFSKTYAAHSELMEPDRPGYHSDNENLFFYKTSGRFEILKIAVVSSGLKTETTTGACKSFKPSKVFK
jgi:hypothetical protein